MARAVSTVLDVAVCLLLIGVAITTLVVGIPTEAELDRQTIDSDSTAATLATVTTTVPNGHGGLAHDTVASHLATAAVADAAIEDETVDTTAYPAAVRNETTDIVDDRVLVTATWSPYPDAPLGGRLVVGQETPPDADVSVATLTVDSGIERSSRPGSFDALARGLAEVYVNWLFPPERTRATLVDARTAPTTTARYRSAATAVGENVDESLVDANTRRANAALSSGLTERFEADLRSRYPTPEAAAATLTIDEVEIVVRRWEP